MTRSEDAENDKPILNRFKISARHVPEASIEIVEPVIIVEDLRNHSWVAWVI